MAELGIGADTLRAHMLRPDSPAAHNLAALLSARRLTPAAARKVWGVADLKKSAAWGQLRLDEAPTVIASHNARALYVTHGDVGRLLVPQVCARLGARGRARRPPPTHPHPRERPSARARRSTCCCKACRRSRSRCARLASPARRVRAAGAEGACARPCARARARR